MEYIRRVPISIELESFVIQKTMYFPTAAPDENPQEHVWKSGRSEVSHNAFIQNIDVAADSFVDYLNTTKFPYSLVGLSSLS